MFPLAVHSRHCAADKTALGTGHLARHSLILLRLSTIVVHHQPEIYSLLLSVKQNYDIIDTYDCIDLCIQLLHATHA